MARRVVSLVRGPLAAPGAADPAVEANAWAIAEDVHLTLVLTDHGVELAVAGGEVQPSELAGVALPPAATGQDLRGLIESGVGVYVDAAALVQRGVAGDALVEGVQRVDADELAALLRRADAVLAW